MNIELRGRAMRSEDDKLLYLGKHLVCDGVETFYDTGFAPFSSENANKDFMITIRLGSFTDTINQAVVLGCKYEGTISGQQWPGIYIRRSSTTQFEMGGYSYAKVNIKDVLNKNIYIWRKSGKWQYKVGTGSTGNLNVRVATFNQNIVLGAGVQTDSSKFRYANCVIDYVRIELI